MFRSTSWRFQLLCENIKEVCLAHLCETWVKRPMKKSLEWKCVSNTRRLVIFKNEYNTESTQVILPTTNLCELQIVLKSRRNLAAFISGAIVFPVQIIILTLHFCWSAWTSPVSDCCCFCRDDFSLSISSWWDST